MDVAFMPTSILFEFGYSNVEKPTGIGSGSGSGDVNGGSSKYDYRPSTTLDNRRRKYNKNILCDSFNREQKIESSVVYLYFLLLVDK